jgi:hypothetical protein
VKKTGTGIPKIGQTGTQPTKTQTQQQVVDFDLLDDKPVGGSTDTNTTTTTTNSNNNSSGNVFQWNQPTTTVTNSNTTSGTTNTQNPCNLPFFLSSLVGWSGSSQPTTQQPSTTQTNNPNPFNWSGSQQQPSNTVTNTSTNLTNLGSLYTQPSSTNTFGGFTQQQQPQQQQQVFQQNTFQQTTFQQPSNTGSLGNVNFNAFGTNTTQQKTTTTTTTIQNTPPKSSDFEFDDFQTAGNTNNSKIKSIKPVPSPPSISNL